MNTHSSLSDSASPFAHLAEPSDLAYVVAASVEHMLNKHGFKDLPSRDMARAIDANLKSMDKRYVAMETALAMACQTALIHGASGDEMRAIHDKMAEGDKALS